MAFRHTEKKYQKRGHVINTAPATEPVTAAEFKDHVSDSSLTDAQADAWVASARAMIEENTGIAMITQVWDMALDNWPTGRSDEWWSGVRLGALSEIAGPSRDVCLPRYPLASVDSVKTYDEASNETTLAVSTYFDVDTFRKPGRLALKSGQSWPVALRPTNAIMITYTAGYVGAANVPEPLKLAVKIVGAYLYSHRGDDCDPGDAMAGAASIINQYISRVM